MFTLRSAFAVTARPAAASLVASRTAPAAARSIHCSPSLRNEEFKREPPKAPKNDSSRFDNSENSPQYPNEGQKRAARSGNESPISPPQDRNEAPHPETPAGQHGSFADQQGGGKRSEGEGMSGTEDAKETRSHNRVGQAVKNTVKNVASALSGGNSNSSGGAAPSGARGFASSSASSYSQSGPPKPTFESRNTPRNDAIRPEHPGYTSYDTPTQSTDPGSMSGVGRSTIKPHGDAQYASTVMSEQHVEVHTMAKGAEQTGSDAVTPEERNQKVWGANTRAQDFNEHEGKRNPVHDGGSNEAGGKTTT